MTKENIAKAEKKIAQGESKVQAEPKHDTEKPALKVDTPELSRRASGEAEIPAPKSGIAPTAISGSTGTTSEVASENATAEIVSPAEAQLASESS